MSTLTKNGVTTTMDPGSENWKSFSLPTGRRGKLRRFVQYDYRHTNGGLFSCVKPTLKECREARNLQLQRGLIY